MTLRLLAAYSAAGTHVQTTMDYLLALRQYSGFNVSFVHVTHDAIMDFDMNEFDVVFHNYCALLCVKGYVSESYRKALRDFGGLKVLSVQDEYDQTNVLKAAIKDLGFHVLCTCVPANFREYVYPRSEFPNVHFEQVLTGYVPLSLTETHGPSIPLRQRPVVVGYRARALPAFYGQLAYEKALVGQRMKEVCDARGIVNDISMSDADRIYGTKWLDFVGSCRAMVGSESGSNVFDFDGSIRTLYDSMTRAKGSLVTYEEFLPLVAELERKIDMSQISPRIFECAVMRTPMILFRGRYSDVIKAEEHYIVLEKDFSNIDEVLTKLEDFDALEDMAERTYRHVVASGRFGYRSFAGRLADLIREQILARKLDVKSVA